MNQLFLFLIIIGIITLIFAGYLSLMVIRAENGTEKMHEIAGFIRNGANTFIKSEYQYLSIFVVVIAFAIGLAINHGTALAFILGAVFSMAAGYFGMRIATIANVKTAQAARKTQTAALNVAFSGGAIMGLLVVGFAVLGLGSLLLLFKGDPINIAGFGLGASSIALFARVGGGIYTKAGDVGADLAGKIEANIPEDDPRNPAVIADNVGDNVGDVAGMGADLFESYVNSIVSAISLGMLTFNVEGIYFVLILVAVGIVSSMIAIVFVKLSSGENPQKTLNYGSYVSGLLVLLGTWFLSHHIFGDYRAFIAVATGLIVGVLIGITTEMFTSSDYKRVQRIAYESLSGSATNIIAGLGEGMFSTMPPTLYIVVGILVSYYAMGGNTMPTQGLYGIALAAIGMLSTTGFTIAIDAYGPIADNAGGIAQMADLPPSVREITDTLDAVGNTTAAIGKGFAIGSAALTSLALFVSYAETVKLSTINLLYPLTLVGLFIGGMIPFLFSALSMKSVSKAANEMVQEVRRQFDEIEGILEGTATPEYDKCVAISTKAALKEMILPGVIAILTPLVIGLGFGVEILGGLMAGTIISGVLLALMMSNAGGAWDNAKKLIESGEHGGKGSAAHHAGVVGDTVGDPFKDTAGPAMNILIKLMTVIALVFAPFIMQYGGLFFKLFNIN
ncbi:MAG: sodium-translocating pyrophosphatase [Erysipelothrix sp.]|nr:sodium-translocating pyrophosphatase [Erysipelothrix sp.]